MEIDADEAATVAATIAVAVPRIEIVSEHRRSHDAAFRAQVLAEARHPGVRVRDVARRHEICTSLIYRWRRPFGGSGPPAVLYRYSPDRKGEHPRAHLQGFVGILQADGYSGFKALNADGRITEASCWAHARRGFFEAYEKTRSPLAREALDRIGAFYRVEEFVRGRTPGQRLVLRGERSAPLMDELRTWLHATLPRISGRSELAKAIRYALARWDSLTNVLRDGRVCIDNSAAERAMRPIAIGRRNWTFAGSDPGGARAAAIYSLIETARINGADPEDYLRRMLERIADYPVSQVGDLLPWNMVGLKPRLNQRIAA